MISDEYDWCGVRIGATEGAPMPSKRKNRSKLSHEDRVILVCCHSLEDLWRRGLILINDSPITAKGLRFAERLLAKGFVVTQKEADAVLEMLRSEGFNIRFNVEVN